MKKPFFSIITCTYNTAKFVDKNIKSVKEQTHKDWEHVFVDAYSNDETEKLLQKYRKQFPKKVKIFKQKPRGISSAMNFGINKSQGDIIIHLHSDDYFYDKNVLQDISEQFESKSSLDWVYGKSNVVEKDGRRVGVFPNRKIFQRPSTSMLRFFNFVPHQTVFIKRKVFKKYGYFDEGLSSQMDWDMWLRISNKTEWEFINRLICCYTIRKGALSSDLRNREANKKNNLKVARRYLSSFEMLPYRLFRFFVKRYNKTHR